VRHIAASEKHQDRAKRAIDLLRYSFFVDCDFARAAKTIAAP